jgi:2-dehydro-3-deoxyphosphooctonate aldolase (KDO 8-P synthase)
MQKSVDLGNTVFSNKKKLVLIAGPCVLESYEHAKMMTESLLEITSRLNIDFVYKTSFDKANRTSINSERGLGIGQSIEIFNKLRSEYGIHILTDIHNVDDCNKIKDHVDILQIPAFLCRQTDLLIAAAKTNKVINIKKGQFLAPMDMVNVAKKVSDSGNNKILLTERGVSFGYNALVSDMKSLHVMKEEIGFPVVFDATHSVQSPGGRGDRSGGDRKFVPTLAKAAVAVGVSSVFMETHDNPDIAPSDGPNMVKLDELEKLVAKLIQIDNLVKEN